MGDVLVTQILLNRPRVMPVIRQLVAASMAEHVWMGGEEEFRLSTGPGATILRTVDGVSGPLRSVTNT